MGIPSSPPPSFLTLLPFLLLNPSSYIMNTCCIRGYGIWYICEGIASLVGLHSIPGLLCGLLKETTGGLEQRLGGAVKAVREWERMLAKAR